MQLVQARFVKTMEWLQFPALEGQQGSHEIFQGHLALPAGILASAALRPLASWQRLGGSRRAKLSEARGIVSLIKDSAAKATILTHKLRGRNAKVQMHPGTILGNASGFFGCTGKARII
jgi:hypothetical protein